MEEADRPAEQIEHIHAIMARSTTFVSLSGLAGISAGIVGLAAWRQLCLMIDTPWPTEETFTVLRESPNLVRSIGIVFSLALVAALVVSFLFSWRKARRYQLDLWNMASRRFAVHLALPLVAGGVFVLALAQQGTYELICPAMLVFFGLALLNAGKYSFSETVVFGVIELALGLTAALWIEAGLVLWGIGFGVVTAGYGIIMYLQHER